MTLLGSEILKYPANRNLSRGLCRVKMLSVSVNESECAINCLMTLYLINRSHEHINGITKLQKLAFIAQKEMNQEGIQVFSGEFFRWNYGPMSDEVYDTNYVLAENNLIKDGALGLSGRGKDIIDDFDYVIGKNSEIFSIIDECVDKYAHLSLREIKEKVYSMKVVPYGGVDEQTIKDLPLGTTILRNKGFFSLNIEEDDVETLEIYLDEFMYQSLLRSIEDAKCGRIYSRSEDCLYV